MRVAAELKALGRPFPRALELGSGPGELAETVLHEVPGLRLVCLDLSEGACREAPADLGSKEGRMTCVTRSLFDPGWADGLGRFDAVIVGPALHERHPGPGKVAFYARVRTLLLPGGILLLCDRATGAGDPRNAASLGVEDALGEAGIEFLPGSGVRVRDASVQILHGNTGLAEFLDDVFGSIVKTDDKEILIMGNSEVKMEDTELRRIVESHIARLNAGGIKEKILAEEGDTNFIAPWHWYRWLPKNFFTNSPFLIYGQKLGMIVWGPPIKITVLSDPEYTENVRKLFMFAWDRASVPAVEGA